MTETTPKTDKIRSAFIMTATLAVPTVIVGAFITYQFTFWAVIFGFVGVVLLVVTVLLAGEDSSRWLHKLIARDGPPSLYDWTLDKCLPWLRSKLDIAEPADDAGLLRLLRDAFTYRLLDRAMLFAVVYPVLLLIFFWGLTGRAGTLGAVEVIPAADPYWHGIATLCGIAVVVASFACQEAVQARPRSLLRRFSGLLGLFGFVFLVQILDLPSIAVAGTFAGAITGAVAVAGAGAMAGAVAVAGAMAGAVAVAVTFAVAVAGAVTFAVAFAFAFIISMKYLERKNQHVIKVALALCFPLLAITLATLSLPWAGIAEVNPAASTLFLFLAVLPFINALFDTVSYGATLALIQRGRRNWPLFYGLVVDPVLALVLFLGLAGVLVCVTWAMGEVTGVPFADLPTLLTAPFDTSQYLWLYLMLFSTALPTVVHMLLAVASLHRVVPLTWREWVASWTDVSRKDELYLQFSGMLILGVYVCAALGIAWFTIWGIAKLAWHWGLEAFLYFYRDLLVDLLVWLSN